MAFDPCERSWSQNQKFCGRGSEIRTHVVLAPKASAITGLGDTPTIKTLYCKLVSKSTVNFIY